MTEHDGGRRGDVCVCVCVCVCVLYLVCRCRYLDGETAKRRKGVSLLEKGDHAVLSGMDMLAADESHYYNNA